MPRFISGYTGFKPGEKFRYGSRPLSSSRPPSVLPLPRLSHENKQTIRGVNHGREEEMTKFEREMERNFVRRTSNEPQKYNQDLRADPHFWSLRDVGVQVPSRMSSAGGSPKQSYANLKRREEARVGNAVYARNTTNGQSHVDSFRSRQARGREYIDINRREEARVYDGVQAGNTMNRQGYSMNYPSNQRARERDYANMNGQEASRVSRVDALNNEVFERNHRNQGYQRESENMNGYDDITNRVSNGHYIRNTQNRNPHERRYPDESKLTEKIISYHLV